MKQLENCYLFMKLLLTLLIVLIITFMNKSAEEVFLYISLVPFAIAVILNYVYDWYDYYKYYDDHLRVKLRNTSINSPNKGFDGHFESLVFGRTTNFKNNASGNLILFKACNTVSVLILLVLPLAYYILLPSYKIIFTSIKPVLSGSIDNEKAGILGLTFKDITLIYFTALASINGLCWLEKNKFKEKWNYLCAMYNDYIKSQDYLESAKIKSKFTIVNNKKSVLLNALAIDAIVTMMWGHRSFKELVLKECILAAKYINNNKDFNVKEGLLNFYFSESELLFVLENYQKHLIGNEYVISGFDLNDKNWFDKAKKTQKEKYLN